MTDPRRLLVLGAGGHGRAVADVAVAAGRTVVGFTEPGGARLGDPPVLGRDDELAVLANRQYRARAPRRAVHGAGCRVPPRARARTPARDGGPTAALAVGAVVFANAVVGAGVAVGENAVIYSGAIIEHDSRIGAHAYLAPGVVVCGGVTIEDGAFVGAGAVLIPGAHVGCGATIGAQSLVRGAVVAGQSVRP